MSDKHQEVATSKIPVTRELARYLVSLKYEDLPRETIQAAKEALLDHLGVMLMGSTLPWTRPSYEVIRDLGGKPEATIVAHGIKVNAPDAAFVNANFGHSCELDDSGFTSGAHPGSVTVSPALALAERGGLGGKDFILAITAGYEALARVGQFMKPGKFGFHAEGVVGPFGSVTAAGKLLRLNAEQMVNALSIAGSHSSGTHEYDQSGGDVKRVHAAIASRGGVMSALLAQRGLTGPHTILEGIHGVPRVFGGVSDPAMIEATLKSFNDNWFAIQGRVVKPYPAVGTIHTSIQAMTRLIQQGAFQPAEIEEIRVGVNPTTLSHGGAISRPTDTTSAQYSMGFSLGVLLLKGRIGLQEYMNSALWSDPKILAFADKLRMDVNPKMVEGMRYGVHMQVKLKNGQIVETEELYRKGSAKNPLTREDLVAKFSGLASAVLDEKGMREVVETVYRLEEVDNISELIRLLVKR